MLLDHYKRNEEGIIEIGMRLGVMKRLVLIKCCLRYGGYFVLGVVLSYLLSLVMVRGSTLIGDAIDTMLAKGVVEFEEIFAVLLLFVVVGTIGAFLKSLFLSKFSILVQTDYKNLVVEKLYHLEYSYFDHNGSATIMNKINTDIAEIELLLNMDLPGICSNAVNMMVYAVFIGQMHLGLLVLMFVCYPLIFYFTNRIVKKIEDLRKTFRQKSDLITEISQDCISGILVLRAFQAEGYFQKKLDQAADDLVENEEKRARISNTAILVRRMLQWIPNIICAIVAFFMVLYGKIRMGELVVFFMILQRFVDEFVELPFHLVDIKEHLICVKRVEAILAESEEKSGTEKEGWDTEEVISFERIGFSYGDGKEILKELSFSIKRNSSVALVGDSGGGKSTIFRLLCGFYHADQGSYRLFGKEFATWDIEAARGQMALVSQNVFLFPVSIFENVRYGNRDATKEQVIRACQSAGIHDFIMELPKQYDTIVGERGVLLSGGERQRISIARAFLKNAPILLLDEPTSAVDVATEEAIQKALQQLGKDKTCITIAHRLSTIQQADCILVIQNGKVVESGTHKSLLSKNGAYTALYGKEVLKP